MRQTIQHWLLLLLSVLVLGPAAWMMTASLTASDGGPQTSLLVNASVGMGVLVTAGVFLLAALVGLGAARLAGLRHGLLCVGLVLAWAAFGTGQIDRILHRTLSASTMYALTGEAILVGALGVGLAAAMILIARREPHADPAPSGTAHHPPEPRVLWDKATPAALAAALVVAALIGWLVAQDTLKGQTFAAAAFAGMFGATAGRMAAPTASALTFVAALALLAIAAPAVATFMHGSTLGPTRAALGQTLFPLARPLPLDWIAGAFVGIPLGLSWAASLTDRQSSAPV